MSPEQQSPSTVPTSEGRPRISRRAFLFTGGATVVGAAIATVANKVGLWSLDDLGMGELAALERKLQQERDAFAADYLKDPEADVNTQEAARLFLQTEVIRYMRDHRQQQQVSPDTFGEKYYRPSMDAMGQNYDARQAEKQGEDPDVATFGTPSVSMIADAKLALFDQFGNEPHYWAKMNNVVDPIMTGDLQCRSGSRLLLLALLEKVEPHLQPGEQLVSILSNHHLQVGLLTADGNVIAFEMTKSGKGIQVLGPMKDITTPILITDAKHDLAQAAINRRAHPEQTILYENVPEDYAGMDRIFDRQGVAGGGGIHLPNFRFGIGGATATTTDQYGFGDGKLEIPEERIPITSMDYVPSSFDTGTGTGEGGQSIYDTVNDSEKKYGDLFSRMLPDEARAVREYEQHSPIFSRHMNQVSNSYSRIMSGDQGVDIKAEAQKLGKSCKEIAAYMNQNDLDRKYDVYRAALKKFHERTGTDISFPRNPREYALEVLEDLSNLGR